MPAAPSPSPRPARLPQWLGPAALAALALGAGAAIWAYRGPPPDPPAPPGPIALPGGRVLPVPVPEGAAGLHSVTAGVENGVRVLRIRVTPGGDELIVDAATGRLLETRPARPAAPAAKPMFHAP